MPTVSNSYSMNGYTQFQKTGPVYINSVRIHIKQGDSLQTVARKINQSTGRHGVSASINSKGELLLNAKDGKIAIRDKFGIFFNRGNTANNHIIAKKLADELSLSNSVIYEKGSGVLKEENSKFDTSQTYSRFSVRRKGIDALTDINLTYSDSDASDDDVSPEESVIQKISPLSGVTGYKMKKYSDSNQENSSMHSNISKKISFEDVSTLKKNLMQDVFVNLDITTKASAGVIPIKTITLPEEESKEINDVKQKKPKIEHLTLTEINKASASFLKNSNTKKKLLMQHIFYILHHQKNLSKKYPLEPKPQNFNNRKYISQALIDLDIFIKGKIKIRECIKNNKWSDLCNKLKPLLPIGPTGKKPHFATHRFSSFYG